MAWNDPTQPFSRFLHRVLRRPTPHLLSLTLCCESLEPVSAILNTLAGNTQLTELSLSVCTSDRERYPRYSPPLPEKHPELPALPSLRTLSIQLPCKDYMADRQQVAKLVIGLSNLSEMSLLTRLDFGITSVDFEDDENSEEDEACLTDTEPAMQPVSDALASLTEMRHLTLHSWSACKGRSLAPRWQALAAALPTLQTLTCLELRDLLVPNKSCDPACFHALAAGISGLTSLRSLTITAHERTTFDPPDADVVEEGEEASDPREASAALACALGSLTGLTQLTLEDRGEQAFLCLDDCCLHLRSLSSLRALSLALEDPDLEEPEDLRSQSGATHLGDMLSGMPGLVKLSYWCTGCRELVSCTSSDGATCLRTGCPRCIKTPCS